MYLWLLPASATYGLLILLDLLIYTYIASRLEATSLYLGLCNAIWSITYILSTYGLGKLADSGRPRILMALSAIGLAVSLACISNLDLVRGLAAYTFHAISLVTANLSINTIVFENIDSENWRRALLVVRTFAFGTRGVLLIALATMQLTNIAPMLMVALVLAIASSVSVPSTAVLTERELYRLYGIAKNVNTYLKASTSLLYMDRPDVMRTLFSRLWESRPKIETSRVLIASMLVVATGEYVLAFLPLMVKNFVSLQTLWIAYGISSLSSVAVMLLLHNMESERKNLAQLMIALRTFTLLGGFVYARDATTLAGYLFITSAMFFVIDTTLYNLFISSTGGYRISLYHVFRELGSVVGSLLGGVLLPMGTNVYVGTALIMTALSIVVLF